MDNFEKRLKAAHQAGWNAWFIGLAILIVEYGIYLAVLNLKWEWMLWFGGPGANWELVQNVWSRGIIYSKFTLEALLVIVLWIHFWYRSLKKM